MTKDKIISGLKMTMELFLFDPSTGETCEPDDLNELNRTTYDACKGAVELLQNEPHWIPVEQALPEYGVDCIVSVKQKYTWQTDWEYFVDLGWRGDYIDGAWDTANDWDEGQETHISAWMPLPEPFKGVTS